jgi:glycine/D-amino acid oxidase-like deaminating enzyme/nitrite reductase/ring-hydroxylating ferredoxin subunit
MIRDGHLKSIWQNENRSLPVKNLEASSKNIWDVTVIGAGITGLTTALLLQEQGFRCLLVEAQELGFGTTLGTSAHLNTVLDVPYDQLIQQHGLLHAKRVAQSALEALLLIEDLVSKHQISCDFQFMDGYIYAEDWKEGRQLKKLKKSIEEIGLPVSDQHPFPAPFDPIAGICFENQAIIHPAKYINGLAQAFIQAGGTIWEHTPIHQVEYATKKSLIYLFSSGRQKIKTQQLVYATHTVPGIHNFNMKLKPYRSYLQVWELANIQQYPSGLIYDMKDPFHYIRPVEIDGKVALMVGGEDHPTGQSRDERDHFLRLEEFVCRHYQVKQKLAEWSSQFYESHDHLPFIGAHPQDSTKSTWIATGFGGNGLIFGSIAGKMLSALIATGNHTYKALYDPARASWKRGFWSYLGNIFQMSAQMLRHRINTPQELKPQALTPGHGEMVHWKQKQIGVFQDEHSQLHAVKAICRHMGCTVKWNFAEKSWDCPCHGARYNPQGEMLNGPTLKPLKKIDLPSSFSLHKKEK